MTTGLGVESNPTLTTAKPLQSQARVTEVDDVSEQAMTARRLGLVKTDEPSIVDPTRSNAASEGALVSYQAQDVKSSEQVVQLIESDVDLDTDVDAETETGPENDADPETDADQDAETDTETDSSDSLDDDPAADRESDSSEEQEETGDLPMRVPPSDFASSLTLDHVLCSVSECYPEIEIAVGELETAHGKVLASWGQFDEILTAHSISQPMGFYQTYRNGVALQRPLYGGGEVYGSYRIGDGNFEPWYGERETNEGGEFKAGFSLPLLKDRQIDARRLAVGASRLQREQLQSNIETRLLEFERFASYAYWDWVASGIAVQIQQQLLSLAQTRVKQIDLRMEAGDLAAIAGIDNDRFIAKRTNGLIKAQRGLEKAAIKLSLFLRDANCQPMIANESLLPADFPNASELPFPQIESDIAMALNSRPELVELNAARREACLQRRYAENLMLPKLDVKGFAGQDVGGETSSTGDKTPFELQLGVYAEVPIQRREGAGKIQAANGKIAQIDAKRQLVSDKIRAGIQDAASAVNNAAQQIMQSQENVRLTQESLRLGRLAFEAGDIELLALNIYESSVADAKLQLLEAHFKYFTSLAQYKTLVRPTAFSTADQF